MKKVLHFIDSSGLYGAESVILNLSRELQEDGKYQPVVGCIVSGPDQHNALYGKAQELGFTAEKLVLRNHLFFIDILKIARRLRGLKIDLIHSHGYKPSVYGYLLGLLLAIPITATCHLWFFEEKLPLKKRVMISLELFLYRYFPVIVTVSEPILDFLVARGVQRGRMKVVNNGIVLSDYQPLGPEEIGRVREKLQVSPDELCVLNVGRLAPQKAQVHIIDAAVQLKKEGLRMKFFIVGEGELKESLAQRVREKDIADCVQFLGFRSDIRHLLQAADIFVLPSLEEGMPMALLEAVASRTPVLATGVGDIPKLIETDRTGVIVDRNDVIGLVNGLRCMAGSSSSRKRLAEEAFAAFCELYSSAAMSKSYKAIYASLIG